MILEEQGAGGFENCAKIVVADIEKDESTIVGSDMQFELQPAKVEIPRKQIYKGQMGIGLRKPVLYPTTGLVDPGEVSNIFNEDYLKPQ